MDIQVENALERARVIGAGCRAVVYELDENWVVKHLQDEYDGFWAIVGLSDHIRERLQMPRIDLYRSDVDEGIIVMEKLFRIDYDLFVGTDDVHSRMNELHHLPNPHTFNIDRHLISSHPLYPITKQIYRAWKFVNRIGYPVSIDVNPSNIMIRKDGTLIMSDPFGYLDI